MGAKSEKPGRDHPLADVVGLDAASLERLAGQWVGTAEQALALASTPEGREGLRRLLELGEPGLARMLELLRSAVGRERAAALEKPDAGRPPDGALLTDEQKRRFGIQ